MTDAEKLALADGRERAREQRQAERAARLARGRDYFDVVPSSPEERAEKAPDVAAVAAKAAAAASGGSDATAIAAAVAAAVAQVFTQHAPPPPATGPRPVPPEIQRRRNEAHDRMLVLIDDIKQDRREVPIYVLTQDFYDGWQLHTAMRLRKGPDGTSESYARIRWRDAPNETMRPVNQSAKEVYAAYMESIGGETPDLGEQSYQAYRQRPRYPEVAVDADMPMQTPLFPDRNPTPGQRAELLTDTPEEEVVYAGPPPVMGTIKQTEGPTRY